MNISTSAKNKSHSYMNEKVIFRVVFDNFPNVYILMERVGTGEHWGGGERWVHEQVGRISVIWSLDCGWQEKLNSTVEILSSYLQKQSESFQNSTIHGMHT